MSTRKKGDERQKAEEILSKAGVPLDPPAAPEPWDEPLALGSRAALPAFPLTAFPDYIAHMVAGMAEELQVPVDLPGTLALSGLSTAAGGRAEVVVRGQWREPLCLYLATAMPPGSGKSPAFRAMLAPVFEAERQMREAARDHIDQAAKDREIALARAEDARRKAKSAQDIELAVDARQMAEATEVPTLPRLTADDISPEQAATVMADQGGRLAILAAEGTFFEVVMGRYSSGKPNVELVLKAHAGDRVQVDRRGREEFIDRPALTIGVAIQPDMLRDIAAKRQMRGRGVLARFLFSLPRDMVGARKITPDTVSEEVIRTYMENLKRLVLDLSEWTDPAAIPISPAALKLFTEWRIEIEPRLKRGTGDLESLRDWASKLPGATIRIAGLLHLAENPDNGVRTPISEETMGRAIDLARYFVEHAMAAFGAMRAHPALDNARSVLEWITEKAGPEFKARDVQRAFQRRFDGADDVRQVLDLLEDHEYIRRAPDTSTGGRRSVVYQVNPKGR
ncbi:DUF3987 domain-containing protein [Spirillospora sp. CA-128828]|uniref:DUF3987 domain-containing protein n=1 Tax=Spirillospora sp. CA-128828 TaxID=3240033 RepID=UPI003D8DEEA3